MGRINSAHFILNVFGSGVALVKLLTSLLVIWLTLNWKVRKARKAFERELVKQGMLTHDARRISAQFAILKDDIENSFKQSLRVWR